MASLETIHHNLPRAVIDAAVENGRERRRAYRADAFIMASGEMTWYYAISDGSQHNIEQQAEAERQLDELARIRAAAVAELPALEDGNGNPSGVTATERFEVFLRNRDVLVSVDVARAEHVGNWSGARGVDSEVERLTQDVSSLEGVMCDIYDTSPSTCAMHIMELQDLCHEEVPSGWVAVGRNSEKFKAQFPGGDVIHLRKRTEFFVNLNALPKEVADIFENLLKEGGPAMRLDGEAFRTMNELIQSHSEHVLPVYSVAYVRRKPHDEDDE